MSSEGYAIAERLIAEEAENQTGELDLSWLGLTELPPALFDFTHLHSLWLGRSGYHDAVTEDRRRLGENEISPELSLISLFAGIRILELTGLQVADLSPLANLASLQSLSCFSTQVADLTPALQLPGTEIDASNCRFASLPTDPALYAAMSRLTLEGATAPGLPDELFQPGSYEYNHALGLAAHFADLQAGHVSLPRAKLIFIGNGRVGKTQVRRRLFDETYDPTILSTHGIQIGERVMPVGAPPRDVSVWAWDFGGQEIYHGTHGLFMRTRAAFAVCWSPTHEEGVEHDPSGLDFRNQPLRYWLDYIRHIAGAEVAVLAIQTKADAVSDDAPLPTGIENRLTQFGYGQSLRYSARLDRNRGSLEDGLSAAFDWMRNRHGDVLVGRGRLDVMNRLDAMRRHQPTLSQAEFAAICAETKGISSPEHLLTFLHNAGVVFYRKDLFGDQIILDQSWALDAIYTAFNRGRSVKFLRANGGRFTRLDLEYLAWRDRPVEEQRLFISMMESCGIAFRSQPRSYDDKEDLAEYIAPDFLPERAAVEHDIAARWAGDPPVERELNYDFLHDGLSRAIIADIGRQARTNAVYWRYGVCAYDTQTRSHLLIEKVQRDGWAGTIRIATRNGQADALMDRVLKSLEQLEASHGVHAEQIVVTAVRRRLPGARVTEVDDPVAVDTAPAFGPAPTTKREIAISYAWKEATPDAPNIEADVDTYCTIKLGEGYAILRDKTHLGIGDRLPEFLDRIGSADRLAIFLSDRYLRRPNCMFELYRAWRHHQSRPDVFNASVRVYCLPCARIWSIADRGAYALHWRKEVEAIKQSVDGDLLLLGDEDMVAVKFMNQFVGEIGNILGTIANTIRPRTLTEFTGLD